MDKQKKLDKAISLGIAKYVQKNTRCDFVRNRMRYVAWFTADGKKIWAEGMTTGEARANLVSESIESAFVIQWYKKEILKLV